MRKYLKLFLIIFIVVIVIFVVFAYSGCNNIVSAMTVRQKIGQMLLLEFREWSPDDTSQSLPVEEMDSHIEEVISKYYIGNVILFGSNLKSTEKSVRLIDAMQKAAVNFGNLPLLVGTDQEGGTVTRLLEGTDMPGNMALGATGNTEYAKESGKVIGRELSALGINCNFAPNVDVNDNPNNPVIGIRSFGADPFIVSGMGGGFVKGLLESGVIPTAKHFPGHGNTGVDSHTGLPMVEKTLDEIKATELVPFKVLIDSGIKMIMTAHIQFPKIDDTVYISKKDGREIYLPATLSKKIITDILRKDLGYEGVIVTDSLSLGAIMENFTEIEAAKLAINAGVDMLCMPVHLKSPQDIEKLEIFINDLEEAIKRGEISESRINESVGRIVKLKKENGILDYKASDDVDSTVKKAREIVGCKEHKEIEKKIAEAAVKVLPDNRLLPFKPKEGDNLLLLAPSENGIKSLEVAVEGLKSNGELRNVKVSTCIYADGDTSNDPVMANLRGSDYILLLTKALQSPELISNIIECIKAAKKSENTALINLGVPAAEGQYREMPLFIETFGFVFNDPTEPRYKPEYMKFCPNVTAAVRMCFGAEK